MNRHTMKAMMATGYGSPEVFELREIERPVAGDHEVLVRVHAATATRADAMMRTGKPYIGRLATGLFRPKNPIPGTGFAGVVEAIGKDVTDFTPGDRVFGETTLGFSTNAEFVSVPDNGVILPMPENMDFAEASTFCDGPLTSLNFLQDLAGIKAGQKVLINGASGSLGTAAVQLAKHFGAEVTAVCSSRNAALVRSLGADHVVDYTGEDFTKATQKFDLIFDTVGKSSFKDCCGILKETGRYISPVLSFRLLIQMVVTARSKGKKAIFGASGLKKDQELRALLAQLIDIFSNGKFQTIIDRQFPLEKLTQAHRYIDGGHKRGNVVIRIVD